MKFQNNFQTFLIKYYMKISYYILYSLSGFQSYVMIRERERDLKNIGNGDKTNIIK